MLSDRHVAEVVRSVDAACAQAENLSKGYLRQPLTPHAFCLTPERVRDGIKRLVETAVTWPNCPPAAGITAKLSG